MDAYRTLAEDGKYEFTEKRSRFIGYAKPVSTEREALEFIASVKNEHKTATHNVYAYSLRENNLQRYSDDGEPQGTAGLPVLDIIKRAGITDAALVVTRYFGGTLLGTGGLVRAYSEAAKLAVKDARVALMEVCSVYSVCCDYADYDRLGKIIENIGASVTASDFGERIRLEVAVMRENGERLVESVRELTRGKELPELLEEKFVPVSYE